MVELTAFVGTELVLMSPLRPGNAEDRENAAAVLEELARQLRADEVIL